MMILLKKKKKTEEHLQHLIYEQTKMSNSLVLYQ